MAAVDVKDNGNPPTKESLQTNSENLDDFLSEVFNTVVSKSVTVTLLTANRGSRLSS